MTRTVWAENQVGLVKPEYVAPLIAALCSEKPPATGQLYEAGSGSFKHTRWQRARGVDFDCNKGVPEIEEVAKVRGYECIMAYLTRLADACAGIP
jgi:multifunctional beta-oxidation protein